MGLHQGLSGVFIGDGSLLVQCAEIFLRTGNRVAGIVSIDPRVTQWASEKDIPLYSLTDDLAASLASQPFDYLFSIVNLAILPPAVVALPTKLAINFHDSLLPKFAGVHATSWALLDAAPQQRHGVTWHEMTASVDEGRILKQRAVEISATESAFSLNTKCYEAGIQSFEELVEELSTETVTLADPQLDQRTYFGKYARPEAACTITWEQTAEEISALVRALDFGPYPNPMGQATISLGDAAVILREVEILDTTSPVAPGTILGSDAGVIHVATGSRDIALRALSTVEGQPLTTPEFLNRFGLQVGQRFSALARETRERLTALNRQTSRHEELWVGRLASLNLIELPYANRTSALIGLGRYATADMPISAGHAAARNGSDTADAPADAVTAALLAYLARLSDRSTFDVGFSEPSMRGDIAGFESLFASQVPLRVTLREQDRVNDALQAIHTEIAQAKKGKTYLRSVTARFPALQALQARGGQPTFPIAVEIVGDLDAYRPRTGSELTVLVAADGTATRWIHDPAVFSGQDVVAMQRQFAQFLSGAAASDLPLTQVSLLTDEERVQVLSTWNSTQTAYPDSACIHQLIEAQADRSPDSIAVVFEHSQITYAELDARANQVARHLQGMGVGPESLVGVCMERSIDLIVALVGIHKAGGAYVPLDPGYPRDRLSFMAGDAELSVLLTQESLLQQLPEHSAQVVRLDTEWDIIARQSTERPTSAVTAENLAYVIYTSGSTGKPKGVTVGHRNVVNFFSGMDERIEVSPEGVWLAVTSLSFDISVLELFWTLSRGFKVVLYSDRTKAASRGLAPRSPASNKDIAFSLFYFASDEGEGVANKYRLLMEGAKFADQNGFQAVWTPERHFHDFGGLYPNPSVVSAAIAAVTERVNIRAGSVVLPLHSPIRVAEEWSLVDNLSNGRVGISFAAGWQPNDFVISPKNFADRKNVMLREIETVRKLWRGESAMFAGPDGQDVAVTTLPRPVQSELPVWVTAAGSPETFRMAGEIGAGLLTHLLGQSLEELTEKLAIYRRAWRESGHAGNGHVTLMLHTFVGESDDAVRETVRGPMKSYLRSSIDLIEKAAWSFPAFANNLKTAGNNPATAFDPGSLTEEVMDALLDHAFDRYFKSSGLFGTPETCLAMVDKLKEIAVDEIACLIDFGVPSTTVLSHLEKLQELKQLSQPVAGDDADFTIAAQIERHAVTHLQCTPSMANMLLMDERTSAALRPLKNMMVGGEAFPPILAKQLRDLVSGDVINMYGPTETTIWSSTHALDTVGSSIPIGRPIANTTLYILDRHLQPVPVGVPGELFIGGDGVVRGYLHRPELTAERFIRDPFDDRPSARLYRTGDLVRYRADGNIEFLGRIDHQVKIRGYRIELGEIEALLQAHPTVKDVVVVAREDVPGDVRLAAYIVPADRATVVAADLRESLKDQLPEFMVPAHIVTLAAFPLTPNAKIDRKALPAPDKVETRPETVFVAPEMGLESIIAGVWHDALGISKIGVNDNFFDLGGHSLLMVQVQQTLRRVLDRNLAITDLFRFPTIHSLASHLSRDGNDAVTTQQSVERADTRRDMRQVMMQRRQMRQAVTR